MPDLKVKHAAVTKDKEGNLLTREEDIAKRWGQYCAELYNHNAVKDMEIIDEDAGGEERQEESILLSEVEAFIRDLKAKKSPGEDNISAELVQHGGTETVKILQKRCNEILE